MKFGLDESTRREPKGCCVRVRDRNNNITRQLLHISMQIFVMDASKIRTVTNQMREVPLYITKYVS